MKRNFDSSCLQNTVDILGDKWTALILYALSASPRTFSDLELGLDSISPRTLSQRLTRLVDEKIIEKQQYCEHPPRFQYVLTTKGRELGEVLQKMDAWGAKYSCQARVATPVSNQHA